jgi:two-component system, cell cycle response regulator
MVRRRHSDEITVITSTMPKARKVDTTTRVAHLIVLGGENVGQVYPLDKPKMVIGRDDRVNIKIMDAGISRQHCSITSDGSGNYALADAGSKNGTFTNNERVETSHKLSDGDKIQIGSQTIFKFSYQDEVETDYAKKMYDAALRDGLTGCFNRRYFDDRLRSEYSFALRHDVPLGLMLIDMDKFKAVNDTHGHPAGDHVLREFSSLVMQRIRTEDVFARYGGEEFALICRETDLAKSSILAERIRHDSATHQYEVSGQILNVTASIGVAALPHPEINSPENLIEAADQALYQAKERGRNCVITQRPKR